MNNLEIQEWLQRGGTIELCLGREVGIGQVEKGSRGQSLQDRRRLRKTRHFQGVVT